MSEIEEGYLMMEVICRRSVGGLIMLTLGLLTLSLAGCGDEGERSSARRETTAPAFNGEAAWGLLARQVSFGPRVPVRPAHAEQLSWMEAFLEESADTLTMHSFTHTTSSGEILELTNL